MPKQKTQDSNDSGGTPSIIGFSHA